MPRRDMIRVRTYKPSTEAIHLFASAPPEPRARRPVDGLRAVAYALLFLSAAVLSQIGEDLDRSLSDALTSFPGFLRLLWLGGFWLAIAWSVTLLVIAAFRQRVPLALSGLGGAGLAIAMSLVAGAIVTDQAGDVITRLFDPGQPPVFPLAALAVTSAVIAVMAPYLTLPLRRFGRVLVAAQMVGSLFLGAAQALGVIASLAIGLFAGAVVHLVRGSPGGFPSVTRVRAALRELGVAVERLEPTELRPEGVAVLTGTDAAGPLDVKVYGRDALDAELVADLWRLAWYRGRRRSARLSRGEYVEHEGFMTMLAERGGVRVPHVVTAGLADNGDALIVVRPAGTPLDGESPELTADQVESLWASWAACTPAALSTTGSTSIGSPPRMRGPPPSATCRRPRCRPASSMPSPIAPSSSHSRR